MAEPVTPGGWLPSVHSGWAYFDIWIMSLIYLFIESLCSLISFCGAQSPICTDE